MLCPYRVVYLPENSCNFENLFDVQYYPLSGQSRNDIQPGVPFSVLGTISVEF